MNNLTNLDPTAQETLDGTSALVTDTDGYIKIKFQLGPIREHGVNGTNIETVVGLLISRLEGFQAGPFNCQENADAIHHLNTAVATLQSRTKTRVAAGVEGTNQAH
jgi:hypothetical protein